MAATGIGQGGLQTGISLSGFTSIANGATAASTAFTIPYVTDATAALCDMANLQITASSFTPTGNPVNIQGVFITEDDGANYDPYFVSNAQLFPADESFFLIQLQAVAQTFVKMKGILLPSVIAAGTNIQLVLFNNSGVSLTISNVTLYPYGSMAG